MPGIQLRPGPVYDDIDAVRSRVGAVCYTAGTETLQTCSQALGCARATENVTITNCRGTGYDAGTFLDDAFKRFGWEASRFWRGLELLRIIFRVAGTGIQCREDE
jgi:hypothetical protein